MAAPIAVGPDTRWRPQSNADCPADVGGDVGHGVVPEDELCNSRVDLSQRFAGFTIPVIIQICVALFQKLLSLVQVLISFIYAKAYSVALFIYIIAKR